MKGIRSIKFILFKLFIFSSWIKLYNRIILGLNEEGDIHTKKNDHIEWNEIENIVSKNCTILKLEDYLVCREVSLQKPIYEKFKDTCSDMRILIAMKKSWKFLGPIENQLSAIEEIIMLAKSANCVFLLRMFRLKYLSCRM